MSEFVHLVYRASETFVILPLNPTTRNHEQNLLTEKKVLAFSSWHCTVAYGLGIWWTGRSSGAWKCHCPSENMRELVTNPYENLPLHLEKPNTSNTNRLEWRETIVSSKYIGTCPDESRYYITYYIRHYITLLCYITLYYYNILHNTTNLLHPTEFNFGRRVLETFLYLA